MAQVFEYNAFKALYNFEMQDSLPPCSDLNKNLKTDKLSYVAVIG